MIWVGMDDGTTYLTEGLTIGLISLDPTQLRILKKSGDENQRRYAHIVEPIRRQGHLLLCTLLIANMLANEALPIVLDNLVSKGWQAVIISTALIVLFGEIIPQAFCSLFGLAVGANTAWLIKIVMFVLFPIAWPISKLLFLCLGEHEGTRYKRAGD